VFSINYQHIKSNIANNIIKINDIQRLKRVFKKIGIYNLSSSNKIYFYGGEYYG